MTTPSTPAEQRFGGSWRMLIPFLFLPLLIVAGSVGVFLLFGKLADIEKGPFEYLQDMTSGSEHKRWQAAFELSKYLSSKKIENVDKFETEMLQILQNSKNENDARLRSYIIIGLAQIGTEKSVPVLTDVLSREKNSENKIYSIWALGRIASPNAASIIEEQISSDDAGIRKTAAFSLGFVGEKKHILMLEKLLEDPVEDVRWNASLGLAQLGSSAGQSTLLQLLDPAYLRQATPNLRDSERNEIMLSAVNAVGKLKLQAAKEPISSLAKSASDQRLRIAANNILQIL